MDNSVPAPRYDGIVIMELHSKYSIGVPTVVLLSGKYLLNKSLHLLVVYSNRSVFASCNEPPSVRIVVDALD